MVLTMPIFICKYVMGSFFAEKCDHKTMFFAEKCHHKTMQNYNH